jgi:TPR repeat protein
LQHKAQEKLKKINLAFEAIQRSQVRREQHHEPEDRQSENSTRNEYAQDAASLLEAGRMLLNEKGVRPDPRKAALLIGKAAQLGLAEAQYELACLYAEGIGVDRNSSTAWYQAAALQGNADAQCFAGQYCFYGTGVSQDVEAAVEWWRKAAGKNHSAGFLGLGKAYQQGYGSPVAKKIFGKILNSAVGVELGGEHRVEAYKYFILAAAHGGWPQAVVGMWELSQQLSASGIDQAMRRAAPQFPYHKSAPIDEIVRQWLRSYLSELRSYTATAEGYKWRGSCLTGYEKAVAQFSGLDDDVIRYASKRVAGTFLPYGGKNWSHLGEAAARRLGSAFGSKEKRSVAAEEVANLFLFDSWTEYSRAYLALRANFVCRIWVAKNS